MHAEHAYDVDEQQHFAERRMLASSLEPSITFPVRKCMQHVSFAQMQSLACFSLIAPAQKQLT